MKRKSTSINNVAQIAFLVILGLALVFAISTLRGAVPGKLGSNQGVTSVITSSVTSGPDETQTVAAIITFKAIGEATYLATTRTPETPVYLPTGIYDDQRIRASAELLFINAQNAWGGIIDGNRFVLYAGSLQSDPDQGVIGLVTMEPGGTSIEKFTSPTKNGPLRVVTQQNNRMILSTTEGMIFYFDLPTHQFVASLEVTRSMTPSSPGTPEPTELPYPPPTEHNPVAP